jgi:hypothetical protein
MSAFNRTTQLAAEVQTALCHSTSILSRFHLNGWVLVEKVTPECTRVLEVVVATGRHLCIL